MSRAGTGGTSRPSPIRSVIATEYTDLEQLEVDELARKLVWLAAEHSTTRQEAVDALDTAAEALRTKGTEPWELADQEETA